MNKLQAIVGLGLAIGGLLAAAHAFTDDVKTIEHKGLTLAGGAALFTLGATMLHDVENIEGDLRTLFA